MTNIFFQKLDSRCGDLVQRDEWGEPIEDVEDLGDNDLNLDPPEDVASNVLSALLDEMFIDNAKLTRIVREQSKAIEELQMRVSKLDDNRQWFFQPEVI